MHSFSFPSHSFLFLSSSFFFTAIVNIGRLSWSQELSQGCRSASARCLVVKRCDYVEARTPEVSNAVYTRETGLLISPGTFVGQSERFFFAVALRVSSHSRDGSFSRVGRPSPFLARPVYRSTLESVLVIGIQSVSYAAGLMVNESRRIWMKFLLCSVASSCFPVWLYVTALVKFCISTIKHSR